MGGEVVQDRQDPVGSAGKRSPGRATLPGLPDEVEALLAGHRPANRGCESPS